ncbi:MAG TPA: hypothetical protein VFN90_00070, partial [Gemmatimonadales bacterium]|nr:hypothetical protein [Gemmatimonadales bacterium]
MLRPAACSLALVLAALPLAAQQDASWMRYPALSPDGSTIAFVYKGDLYRVPAAGGAATLLTTHPAQEWYPVWSPDGTQLVFASDRYGNPDLFVMPATGGEARRLTYHRAAETPYAFTADGKHVLFGAARQDPASSRLHPTTEMQELYRIPVAGGRPIQMLASPTEEIAVSRDGSRMLYMDHRGRENYWRKHHTSAATRDIWLYETAGNTHRQLTTFAGEDRTPVFLPGDSTFAYLSEAGGTFNVHRWSLASGTSTQLTRFTGAPVRFLSAARNGTLAFGHDGQLYTMAPNGAPQRVAVTIATDAKANAERVIPISSGISQVAVSPNGKEIAFVFRGDVFAASVDGGVTTQITKTPWAEQGPTFAPDGNAIAYASERDGRWAIYEARRARATEPYFFTATAIAETAMVSNAKQNEGPVYSPDGKSLAFVEDRTTLKVLTLATKETKTLLDQRHVWSTGGGLGIEWSPDSRWILFGLDVPGLAPGEVGLVRADGSEPVRNLTQSGFDDRRPRWTHGGKAMLWLSTRDGLKALAQTGGSQADAYAMYFTQDAWDRARLTKEEIALVKEAEEKAEKAKPKGDTTKAAVAPVTLDLDRASDRKQRLTIHSSALSDALLSKDGETLYYLARFERGLNLWSTSLRTRETKMVLALNASSGSMQWDAEQKKIFLVADGGVSTIDPAGAKRESVNIRGEMIVDQLAERQVAFDQVYRRVRDAFYTKGWHGADWEALRTQYARYVPHIGTSHEFAEMLSELLGELNVSHSGANYRPSSPTDDATASLGVLVDQTWAGAGIPIVEVLRGGPMDRAGM